ncbi:MAG: PP0621 family protein [Pseudohongiellaceae bacterium]
MGLIRILIFIMVIWLIWRMIRNYQVKQQQAREASGKLDQKKMVRCEFCNVHLPQSDAVSEKDLWFCNQSHKSKYLDKG